MNKISLYVFGEMLC